MRRVLDWADLARTEESADGNVAHEPAESVAVVIGLTIQADTAALAREKQRSAICR